MTEKIYKSNRNCTFQETAHIKVGVAGLPEDGKEEKALIQKSLSKSI